MTFRSSDTSDGLNRATERNSETPFWNGFENPSGKPYGTGFGGDLFKGI